MRINNNLLRKRKHIRRVTLVFSTILFLGVFHNTVYSQSGWKAPASADANLNPLKGNEVATLAGKKTYAQFCIICHGNKGKGNGVAGMVLNPRPANFTKKIVQNQSDGAIFWKMTEGKAPMASYKQSLTEKQRWQLVNYIRSLGK